MIFPNLSCPRTPTDTERCHLTTKCDLTLFYKGMEALKAGQRPRRGGTGRRSAKLGAASTSTVKQLLGELYADKQFLEVSMDKRV